MQGKTETSASAARLSKLEILLRVHGRRHYPWLNYPIDDPIIVREEVVMSRIPEAESYRFFGPASSILLEVKPPTGEPDAGDPPVRFGGRGGAIQCAVPTPIGC